MIVFTLRNIKMNLLYTLKKQGILNDEIFENLDFEMPDKENKIQI